MNKIWAWIKTVFQPLFKMASGEEPAIAAGFVGIILDFATRVGLHPSAKVQSYISLGIIAFVSWVIRQSVVPTKKLARILDETAELPPEPTTVTTSGGQTVVGTPVVGTVSTSLNLEDVVLDKPADDTVPQGELQLPDVHQTPHGDSN